MKKQLKFDWRDNVIAGSIISKELFLGDFKVGSVRPLVGCPIDDRKFGASTNLPGGLSRFPEQNSMAFAQEKLEAYVEFWFTKTTGEDYENYR